MKKRIAIVYIWSNLDAHPSLCNAALLLSKSGYRVDIFNTAIRNCDVSPDFAHPVFDNPDIEIRNLRTDAFLGGLPRQYDFVRERLKKLGFVFLVLRRLWRAAREWATKWTALLLVFRLHRRSPYCCVIGVDPEGLIRASVLARFTGVPIAYYSLELLLSHELSSDGEKQLKDHELSLSREASFVIIQDEERARLLAKDNQISLDKFILVPNAPLGPARRRRCYYWHQRFGLSSNCRIVLHAGSVGKWTGLEDIVRSVSSWPENWILIVHTYIDPASDDVKRLQEMATPNRVFFSLNAVSQQQLEMLIDAADIGIAFYVGVGDSWYTGQNMRTIGLSSGKIACYLRAGLPVIVNESASISELLQREGCGISVSGRKDIGTAITEINQNYEQYSRQACRMFEKHLDFARAFHQVIERIDFLKKENIPTAEEITLKDQAIP